MQTSGLFTTHSFVVKHKFGVPLHLVIFGDVHRDSPNFADGAWQSFLKRAKSLPNVIFLGMGDMVDSASTSERECLERSAFHESTKNDLVKLAEAKIKLIASELDFMRGRLVGLINGNHFFHFHGDNTNTDQRLARELSCKYLGVCALIRLYIECGTRSQAVDIFAHHGKGASRLIGGSLNRVAQMVEGVEADIFIMGHDHKRGVVPTTPRIYLDHSARDGFKVRHKEVWIARSGSFLASYRDGEVNYNVDAGRLPSSLGHVEMIFTAHHIGRKDGPPDTLSINAWA
jgi:predicted phosphodiesterase